MELYDEVQLWIEESAATCCSTLGVPIHSSVCTLLYTFLELWGSLLHQPKQKLTVYIQHSVGHTTIGTTLLYTCSTKPGDGTGISLI
jgi:hypothetical protein